MVTCGRNGVGIHEESEMRTFLIRKCQYNLPRTFYGGWYRSPRNEKL